MPNFVVSTFCLILLGSLVKVKEVLIGNPHSVIEGRGDSIRVHPKGNKKTRITTTVT
jgi:hypothetical protein